VISRNFAEVINMKTSFLHVNHWVMHPVVLLTILSFMVNLNTEIIWNLYPLLGNERSNYITAVATVTKKHISKQASFYGNN
jgi:hypothetical protein